MPQITMAQVRKQFPQYDNVEDDQLLEAVRQKFYADIPAEQFSSLVVRDLGPKQAQLTDEWRRNTIRSMTAANAADKGFLTRAAANVGAGVQELVTGVQQRYNDMFGDKDRAAELERRAGEERAGAQGLAEATPGGGALQVAGNVLPTMAIPAGAMANTVGRGATLLPRLYQALRAGRAVAPAAATTAKLGTAGLVADSAISGGLYGALRPTTEGESVGDNVLSGAAWSMALPGAGFMVNQGRRMMNGGERAAERVVNDLAGAGADQAARQGVLQRSLAQLRANRPQGPIPLTTAAQLDSADLARLERGSRARNAANWAEFDENQARTVADEVRAGTSEADRLSLRRRARGSTWDRNWAEAQAGADLGQFAGDLAQFRNGLDNALLGPEASNPTVRSMLQAVSDDIDRVVEAGGQYSPAHLQQIRANLSAKFNPMQPNALSGAPRDSAARLSTLEQVDNILNNATGGKWQTVVDDYARQSRLVNASKAAGRVRDSFYDPSTGRVLGVAADAAGDVPKITEAGLGRAITRANGRDGATQLSSRAQTRLDAVLAALRQQGITQRVAKSATAGGGSNTASDTIAAEAAGQVGGALAGAMGVPTWASRVGLGWLENIANNTRDRALAEALQNPNELLRLLEQMERSGRPMSAEQSALMNLLRNTPSAVATN